MVHVLVRALYDMCARCKVRTLQQLDLILNLIYGRRPIYYRLRSWVMNRQTWQYLYDYRNIKIAERDDFVTSGSRSQCYKDFFDGNLYHEIVRTSGGDKGTMYDIFISISCDGFQILENKTYDC